ncbi:hypothetical protein GOBAR_AA23634 [Gossypium barbadense]|uniref:non-specific serine/threonine protein kinase n=1 Tax=Gossypium barbadense TaxID=3634 RepID=A0A2P5X132_GOSBA|nr:hypothetical protein GOBAR_AA23634 [Gossypium barbadense]
MGSTLLAYFLIPAVFLVQVTCFQFNFSTFQKEDESQLTLSRNSYIVLGAIQVTPDVNGGSMQNLSGRALYKKPFRLWKGNHTTIASFNTSFVLNIRSQTSPGGEGVAFLITGNSSLPDNSQGQWLGMVNANTNGSSQASVVAVEFDTRKSDDQDMDGNHIGLNINSIHSTKQVSLSNYGVNISGGDDLRVHLRYDGQKLSVFIGDNQTLVLSQSLDLSTYLPEKVFMGFSGSTSNETELNCVKSWAFSGTDIGGDRNLRWVWIMVPVASVGILVGVAMYLWLRRVYKEEDLEGQGGRLQGNIEDEIKRSNLGPRRFGLKELKLATGNFSLKNKLGKGGFGTVYKGTWRNNDVAVKRVSKKSHQGKQEFIAEVTTIGHLNHKNLVKLIGWCYEKREFLLVYEYMPHGSLDKFIFCDDKPTLQEESTLNWEQRLLIIQGVAQALDYLHNGCQKRVLHRDIKSSNIMLDSEFNAKLGDFGLARTIQEKEKTHHSTIEIAGTPGYMAPETFLISRATVETDVYSFGVLVMEVVSGRKPGNQSELNNYNNSIVNWVWDYYRKGSISGAADSRMDGDFDEKELECVLVLGLGCCHPNPHYRPSMRTVLQVLSGEVDPPQVPQERPSFVWPAMPPSFNHMDDSLTGSQLTPFTDLSVFSWIFCSKQTHEKLDAAKLLGNRGVFQKASDCGMLAENKLGKGGFGTVYKGTWRNNDVAVKRVSKKSHQGKQEFIAEVTTIGHLNHKNLVKLIGWCYEKREFLLVYEYMPHGSLDKFIFCDDKPTLQEESTLNWDQRLLIIQGVAQALDYLHNGCQKRVLHRDIKSSNIMLDSEFNAKLGDFGLARTIQEKEKTHHSTIEIAGTPGYMAPETFLISRATVETDVYSFGVLVMEVVSGRKPGNQSELNNYNNSIVNWVWDYYRKGSISGAADSRMDGDFDEKELECVLVLGLGCCHPNPHYRPSMRTVLQVLSGEVDPPQVPQERPSFVWPAMPPSFNHMDDSLTGSQLTPFTDLSGR